MDARRTRAAAGALSVLGFLGLGLSGCASRARAKTIVPAAEPSPRAVATCPPSSESPLARADSPRERIVELGRSINGAPLELHVFGDAGRPTFVFGGIHGSEPTSAYVAGRLVEYLRENPEAYAGTSVAVLPKANPDGLERRSRTNARRVDLNRNFPARNWHRGSKRSSNYGGPAAASEPETRALIRAVEVLRPARIVTIHAMNGDQCNNFDGPARHLAEIMRQHNRYPVRRSIGYPTPGSFGNWAGVDRGIPTITLELRQGRSGPRCWAENENALLAVIRAGVESVAR